MSIHYRLGNVEKTYMDCSQSRTIGQALTNHRNFVVNRSHHSDHVPITIGPIGSDSTDHRQAVARGLLKYKQNVFKIVHEPTTLSLGRSRLQTELGSLWDLDPSAPRATDSDEDVSTVLDILQRYEAIQTVGRLLSQEEELSYETDQLSFFRMIHLAIANVFLELISKRNSRSAWKYSSPPQSDSKTTSMVDAACHHRIINSDPSLPPSLTSSAALPPALPDSSSTMQSESNSSTLSSTSALAGAGPTIETHSITPTPGLSLPPAPATPATPSSNDAFVTFLRTAIVLVEFKRSEIFTTAFFRIFHHIITNSSGGVTVLCTSRSPYLELDLRPAEWNAAFDSEPGDNGTRQTFQKRCTLMLAQVFGQLHTSRKDICVFTNGEVGFVFKHDKTADGEPMRLQISPMTGSILADRNEHHPNLLETLVALPLSGHGSSNIDTSTAQNQDAAQSMETKDEKGFWRDFRLIKGPAKRDNSTRPNESGWTPNSARPATEAEQQLIDSVHHRPSRYHTGGEHETPIERDTVDLVAAQMVVPVSAIAIPLDHPHLRITSSVLSRSTIGEKPKTMYIHRQMRTHGSLSESDLHLICQVGQWRGRGSIWDAFEGILIRRNPLKRNQLEDKGSESVESSPDSDRPQKRIDNRQQPLGLYNDGNAAAYIPAGKAVTANPHAEHEVTPMVVPGSIQLPVDGHVDPAASPPPNTRVPFPRGAATSTIPSPNPATLSSPDQRMRVLSLASSGAGSSGSSTLVASDADVPKTPGKQVWGAEEDVCDQPQSLVDSSPTRLGTLTRRVLLKMAFDHNPLSIEVVPTSRFRAIECEYSMLTSSLRFEDFVPQIHACWPTVFDAGTLWTMIMDDAGKPIADSWAGFSKDDVFRVHDIVKRLHAIGILHGDIQPRHFLRPKREPDSLYLIDYDHARRTTSVTEIDEEYEKLELDLPLPM